MDSQAYDTHEIDPNMPVLTPNRSIPSAPRPSGNRFELYGGLDSFRALVNGLKPKRKMFFYLARCKLLLKWHRNRLRLREKILLHHMIQPQQMLLKLTIKCHRRVLKRWLFNINKLWKWSSEIRRILKSNEAFTAGLEDEQAIGGSNKTDTSSSKRQHGNHKGKSKFHQLSHWTILIWQQPTKFLNTSTNFFESRENASTKNYAAMPSKSMHPHPKWKLIKTVPPKRTQWQKWCVALFNNNRK